MFSNVLEGWSDPEAISDPAVAQCSRMFSKVMSDQVAMSDPEATSDPEAAKCSPMFSKVMPDPGAMSDPEAVSVPEAMYIYIRPRS